MPYCTPTETGHEGGDAGSRSPGTAGRTGLDEGPPAQGRRPAERGRAPLPGPVDASMKGRPVRGGDRVPILGPVTWGFAGWTRMLARPGCGIGCSGRVMVACGVCLRLLPG